MTISKKRKLELAAQAEFGDVNEMLETATYDSVATGICLQPECDYTCDVEPDCRDGNCEVCNTATVASCLVIAGVV